MRQRPNYISASRRTDIPAFFADEFFSAWKAGAVTYDGGHGQSYTVSLKPDDVVGFIFWSKDFSRFIEHPGFGELIGRCNAVFHYTINDCAALEPHVAPLAGRVDTLRRLCDAAGPRRVLWRFDPICRWQNDAGAWHTNEAPFFDLLPRIASMGVMRCYFSFMSDYAKLTSRGVRFGSFTDEEKAGIAARMQDAAASFGIALHNCCNPEVPRLVPGIRMAHCIDEELLRETDRFGVHPALSIKPTRPGCGCYESRDIGSYLRKCPHGCRYCYGNPVIG